MACSPYTERFGAGHRFQNGLPTGGSGTSRWAYALLGLGCVAAGAAVLAGGSRRTFRRRR